MREDDVDSDIYDHPCRISWESCRSQNLKEVKTTTTKRHPICGSLAISPLHGGDHLNSNNNYSKRICRQSSSLCFLSMQPLKKPKRGEVKATRDEAITASSVRAWTARVHQFRGSSLIQRAAKTLL